MTSFLSGIDLVWKSVRFFSVLFLDQWGLCFLFWISILVVFSSGAVPVGSAAPGYRKWLGPGARMGICMWWRHPATTDPGEAGEGQYQNAGQVSVSPTTTSISLTQVLPPECVLSSVLRHQPPRTVLPFLTLICLNYWLVSPMVPRYTPAPSCYQGKAFLHCLSSLQNNRTKEILCNIEVTSNTWQERGLPLLPSVTHSSMMIVKWVQWFQPTPKPLHSLLWMIRGDLRLQ